MIDNSKQIRFLPPSSDRNQFPSIYGRLFVELGQIPALRADNRDYAHDQNYSAALAACIKFWGDTSNRGTLLRPLNLKESKLSKQAAMQSKFSYDIVCPEKQFINYLDTMGKLPIKFLDIKRSDRELGNSFIPIRIYLPKANNHLPKSPNNERFLQIKGNFPITDTVNDLRQIGNYNFSFVANFFPQPIQSLTESIFMNDSFVQNEKRASQDHMSDNRLPNSLAPSAAPQDYNPAQFQPRVGRQTAKQFETESGFPNFRNRSKSRGPNKRPKVDFSLPIEGENSDPNDNESSTLDKIYDNRIYAMVNNIIDHGRTLQNKMSSKDEPQFSPRENVYSALHQTEEPPRKSPFKLPARIENTLPNENQFQVDEIADLQYDPDIDMIDMTSSQLLPYSAPQPHSKPTKHNLQSEQYGAIPNRLTNLSQITKLKTNIQGLQIVNTKLAKSLKIQDAQLSLDCKIPTTSNINSSIKMDTFTVNSSGRTCDDYYEFSISSTQVMKFNEKNINNLIQSALAIKLEASGNGFNIQCGEGAVPFQKVVLSRGYKTIANVELKGNLKKIINKLDDQLTIKSQNSKNKSKKLLGKKGASDALKKKKKEPEMQQVDSIETIGILSMSLELIGNSNLQQTYEQNSNNTGFIDPNQPNSTSQIQNSQNRNFPAQQQQQLSPLLLQIYLSIRQAKDIKSRPLQYLDSNSPSQFRNLFIKYKTFPTGDNMMTKVQWNNNRPHFKHQSQCALAVTSETLIAMKEKFFLLQVWDRVTASKDQLVGLINLPLRPFFEQFRVGGGDMDKGLSKDGQDLFTYNAILNSLYPCIAVDDFVPIFDLTSAANVGFLRLSLALGTTAQVQRFQDKERREFEAVYASGPDRIFSTIGGGGPNAMSYEIQQQESLQTNVRPQSPHTFGGPNMLHPQQSQLSPSLTSLDGHSHKPSSPLKIKQHALDDEQDGLFGNKKNKNSPSPNRLGAGPALESRHLSHLDLLRKLFQNLRQSGMDVPTFLKKQPLQGITEEEKKQEQQNRIHNGLLDKDELVNAILNSEHIDLKRTDAMQIFDLILKATDSTLQYNPDSLLDINEINHSYQIYAQTVDYFKVKLTQLFEKLTSLIDKQLLTQKQKTQFILALRQLSAPEGVVSMSRFKNQLARFNVGLTGGLKEQIQYYLKIDFSKLDNDEVMSESSGGGAAGGSLINITSFIYFLKHNNTIKNISFMGINIRIFSARVCDEIRNSLEIGKIIRADVKDWISKYVVEGSILKAIHVEKGLRKIGISISLFEVCCLLEKLNAEFGRIFTQPRRFVQIHAQNLSQFFGIDVKQAEAAIRQDANDEAIDIVRWMNQSAIHGAIQGQKNQKQRHNYLKEEDEEGIQITPPPPQTEQKPLSSLLEPTGVFLNEPVPQRPVRRPPPRIKHVFTVMIQKMKNIPILHTLLRDIQPSNKIEQYLQNVALQFRFPLDKEQLIQSDFIKIDSENPTRTPQNYQIGLQSCHSIVLDYEADIDNYFSSQQQFTIRLVIRQHQDGYEQCIGNSQLPGQDLLELIQNFKSKSVNYKDGVAWLNRTLFIYGTAASNKQNNLIGKIQMKITYHTAEVAQPKLKQIPGVKKQLDQSQSVLVQRETLVNRKVPLNGSFILKIDKILGMREALENAEFLQKHMGAGQKHGWNLTKQHELSELYREGMNLRVRCSMFEEDQELSHSFLGENQKTIQGDDKSLSRAYEEEHFILETQQAFNVINHVFDQKFIVKFRMTQKLLDYLKDKRARFQIIHSAHKQEQVIAETWVSLLPLLSNVNGINGEFELTNQMHQSMGYIRLQISMMKTQLMDQQQEQALSSQPLQNQLLPITRGRTHSPGKHYHHQTALSPIGLRNKQVKGDYILALQLSELIMQEQDMEPIYRKVDLQGNERQHTEQSFARETAAGQPKLLYFRYKVLDRNFQSKFMPQYVERLPHVGLNYIVLNKTTLVPFHLPSNTIYETLSKPVQFQLWMRSDPLLRKTAMSSNEIVQDQEQIGVFQVDLSKVINRKLLERAQDDEQIEIVSEEGYYSMFTFKGNKLTPTRLGLKVHVFRRECDSHLNDLESMFLQLPKKGAQQLDTNARSLLDKYESFSANKIEYPMRSTIGSLQNKVQLQQIKEQFQEQNQENEQQQYFVEQSRVQEWKKQFSLHDDYDSGFIPRNVFQNLLDLPHQVLKKNIRIEPNQLDVHNYAHGLNISVDYISFLRHIQARIRNEPRKRKEDFDIVNSRDKFHSFNRELPGNITSPPENVCQFNIEIKGGFGIQHPIQKERKPSLYTKMSNSYNENAEIIQTHNVLNSTNPRWSHASGIFTVPFSQMQNLKFNGFRADVYHKQSYMVQSGFKDERDILVGSCKIDVQSLFISGSRQSENQPLKLNGYFHLQKNIIQGEEAPVQELGQLNIGVTCNWSSMKEYQLSRQQLRGMKQENIKFHRRDQDRTDLSDVYRSLDEANFTIKLGQEKNNRRDEQFNQRMRQSTQTPYILYSNTKSFNEPKMELSVKDITASLDNLQMSLKRFRSEQDPIDTAFQNPSREHYQYQHQDQQYMQQSKGVKQTWNPQNFLRSPVYEKNLIDSDVDISPQPHPKPKSHLIDFNSQGEEEDTSKIENVFEQNMAMKIKQEEAQKQINDDKNNQDLKDIQQDPSTPVSAIQNIKGKKRFDQFDSKEFQRVANIMKIGKQFQEDDDDDE